MRELEAAYRPYYANRAGEEDRARQVGWRDQQAQHARFAQFLRALRHAPDDSFEVADIGCGLGDLLTFLRGRGFSRLLYRGYDILPEMVAAAASSHEDAGAAFQKIETLSEVQPADYCFASGVFNAKADYGDDAWWSHVQTCIRDMAAKSRCGVAFNMLSSYSDEHKRDDTLYYADPCRVFDWCKREISRDVALLHDYGQWDFTILIAIGEGGFHTGAAS